MTWLVGLLGLGALAGMLHWLYAILALMCEDCPRGDIGRGP